MATTGVKTERAADTQGIGIEELPIERIGEFWALHSEYLARDLGVSAEELAYFESGAYRDVIRAHMLRAPDTHRLVYFTEGGRRIGAAQYCTFKSEDGKCLLLDFWLLPPFRGGGAGHRCFAALEAYARADGARYFALNCERENARRFWESLGFAAAGEDEFGMALFVKAPAAGSAELP